MALTCVVSAEGPPGDSYADQVQAVRQQADKLVDPTHPNATQLKQAETLLEQALVTLDQSNVSALAQGNAYLRGRRGDTLRDLAGIFALQGNKDAALAALEAAQAEGWYPDLAPYLRSNKAFASLQDEPRFKAILSTLDSAGRLWSAKTVAVPYAPQLSEAERIAGLSLFWSEVKYNFVHFDHVPNLDWDQVYLDFLPKVIAAKNTVEYYDVMMRLAPLLRDGHTNIYPPDELKKHFDARPPIRARLIEGQVLVTWVGSPTLSRQGIHVGDEILAIDGIEVHRYARERVSPHQSSSTPQDADVRAYTYGLLAGDSEAPLHLTLRDAKGATQNIVVPRDGYHDVQSSPEYVFRWLPGRIAYLSLDAFESDASVKAFEQHLPDILQAKGLILDVRDNGGGSDLYGLQILSYLSGRPVPVVQSREMLVSPAFRAFGETQIAWHKLSNGQPYTHSRMQHFAGPVAVLIGPQTFSAAEDFIVSFDAMERGILVGERTGGSSGQPLRIALPGGGIARICAKRDTYPDGREFIGKGIAPNITIAPTVADIRADRDPVIERAVEALRDKQ